MAVLSLSKGRKIKNTWFLKAFVCTEGVDSIEIGKQFFKSFCYYENPIIVKTEIDLRWKHNSKELISIEDFGEVMVNSLLDYFTHQKNVDLLNNFIKNGVNKVTESVTTTVSNIEGMLNKFIENIAIMLVTACLIPVLVLLFFVWIIKVILQKN